ncbi:MAG: nickel ABC transporter ATP-binding protein [Candidatus Fraserbacteria bacterium RBG_16_55_9]|uniref:Nickel ABC transporter ATP-binding protein n=1 Tax=Fraserbacteria sp. (strain RBG_16_55_9) TaxID=1817864 RepID=A0A1F5UQ50_FRAXR|nr:MAG: nickel ABC transporter ATP-binding protein [Candidatus Fraserbacteria bacterium RBG_16_55_9]
MKIDTEKSTVIFEAERVSFAYNNHQVALQDASLTVRAGERLAILGTNGCGKSTLLKILDGLYFPTSGTLRAFGEPMTEEVLLDGARAYAFRRRVGLVFQDPDVQLFSPTVWDEVTFAPLHLGLPHPEVIERAEWAMSLLDIQKLRDRVPHRLSGGEKKKVALASVLSLRPEVWLLDEPTASLDPRSQSRLLDFIWELEREGNTVITATNDLAILEEVADRVIIFSEDHQIVGEGSPQEVLSNYELLAKCNLIHEHRHKHGEIEHEHPHAHRYTHEHKHEK